MPYSRSPVMVLNYNLVVAHPRSQSHTTMINTLCTVFIGNCCVSSLNCLKGSIIFFILASSCTTHSKSYANRSWKQSSGSDYSVTENNYHVKLTACRGNHSKNTAVFCCCCFFLKLLNWNVIFALFSLLLLAWLKSAPLASPGPAVSPKLYWNVTAELARDLCFYLFFGLSPLSYEAHL